MKFGSRWSPLLVQFSPSPENPSLHSHSKEPSLSVQFALTSHGLEEHSLISRKTNINNIKKDKSVNIRNKDTR